MDAISYADHTAAVDVTIGSGTGNDGGVRDGPAGARDNVQDGEGLAGTAASDRLVGDAEPNSLASGDGDDVLEGGGGDDQHDGRPGTNTASFRRCGQAARRARRFAGD